MSQVNLPSTDAAQAVPERFEEAKQEFLKLLEARAKKKGENKLEILFPDSGPLSRDKYYKHVSFLGAGTQFRERVVFGGNRTGKSLLGGYEVTAHLTGQYPDWWPGKRFTQSVTALACGKDGKVVRDTVQLVLLGNVLKGEFGTGLIPPECLDISKCTRSRAATGLFDEVPVRHVDGTWSLLRFKSYDMGRQAFEGTALDLIWEDEEAPIEIHKENVMRTMTTHGIVLNTFTPLLGETPLVRDLIKRSREGTVFSVNIWWDDCPHITQQMIKSMTSAYAAHELKARRYGEPQLGSGAIFTIAENELVIPPVPLPDYWPRAYGLDFGWTHPTAAVWGALDRESGTVYLYSEHRRSKVEAAVHAASIKARGDWIPGISETAGTNQTDGKKTFEIYKKVHGLRLKKASKGPGSVEAGILLMTEMFTQGRVKVFDNLHMWRSEYRSYHRDEKGRIVKELDDLLDATRYLFTGIEKYARTRAETRMDAHSNVVEVRFGPRR